MATPQTERPLPMVLRDIGDHLEEIVRSELRLAKAEVVEAGKRAARPVISWGVGLVVGFYGFGFLLLAAVYGLSTVMAGWLAALLVGAVLAVVGLVLMSASGKKLKRIDSSKRLQV